MGTPRFAGIILSALLHKKFNIIAIYTQPDKKIGRKQVWQKSPVKIIAEKNNIPVFTPIRLDPDAITEIKKLKPDIIIVAAYGKILPQAVLDLPKFGAINIHASLLPKYRGASPVQNAILNGETETGATIMLMDAGIDTGKILSQHSVQIEKDETNLKLSEKLATISASLLLKTLPLWLAKKITPQRQKESMASFCKIIKREDGKINWNDFAENIYRRFLAFSPWPGIFSIWKRHGILLRIKFNEISFLEETSKKSSKIGKIVKIEKKIGVTTSRGFIILKTIQLEGKQKMKVESFLNGYPDFMGSILE